MTTARPLSPPLPRPADPGEAPIRLIRHGCLRLRLRWRLASLAALLDSHSFWATGRSRRQLGRMLRGSQVVVSAWQGPLLMGFGRATSDGVFRAVLWDVVVAESHQGQGLGRSLVEELLASPPVAVAERTYLMTTTGEGFYERLGFSRVDSQKLMLIQQPGKGPKAEGDQDEQSSSGVERRHQPGAAEAGKKRGEV